MIQVADLSRYQMRPGSTRRIDFAKMRRYPIRGVIMRAAVTAIDGSMGEDYRVRQYVDWLEDYNASVSPEERLPLLGFYDALRLEKDMQRQKDFYLETVKDLPKVRPIPDLEGQRPWGLTPDQAAFRLDDWLTGVAAEVLIWPMIYTTALWFDQFIHPLHWSSYDLWIARYPPLYANLPTISGPWADGKYKPRDWNVERLWQFGTPAIGLECGVESFELDVSLFKGSEEDFEMFAAGMYPQPAPQATQVQVKVVSPNIRYGPSTSTSVVGSARQGQFIELNGEQFGADGHAWYQVKAWMRDDVARKV